MKAAANTSTFTIDTSGQTMAQRTAAAQLDEILTLLNSAPAIATFSPAELSTTRIDTLDHILNGNGAHAGFKQVLAERKQADLGANGLGRLVIAPASGTQVTLSEDVAGSPFGFKLAGVSTLNGATVTGPTGFPPGITIDVTSRSLQSICKDMDLVIRFSRMAATEAIMAAKEISVKKYVVRLSVEEREQLEAVIRKGQERGAAAAEGADIVEGRCVGSR